MTPARFAGKTAVVTGGASGSILVGFLSGNVLTGSTNARNLIIGGYGGNTLTGGNAGSILIAGSTSYDTNTAALLGILAEWNNTTESSSQLFAHLRGVLSGGLNGTAALNSVTVRHPNSASILAGGTGNDWFFAIPGQDTMKNFHSGDTIN
jgi:hypothetical protein